MEVNGRAYPYRDGLTLHSLLSDLALDQRTVVVMRGDTIYRAGSIPNVTLDARDVLEIVAMMQGG